MTLTAIDLLILFGVILASDLVSISIVLMLVRFQGSSLRLLVESIDRVVGKHGEKIEADDKRIGVLEGWRFTVENPPPKDPHHARL
jgi:hypothetical protein